MQATTVVIVVLGLLLAGVTEGEIKVASEEVEECFTWLDTLYKQTKQAVNPGNPATKFDTAEECKQFCKITYPSEARYFSWNHPPRVCRCKRTDEGEMHKTNVISGNVFCQEPEPEPEPEPEDEEESADLDPWRNVNCKWCPCSLDRCELKCSKCSKSVAEGQKAPKPETPPPSDDEALPPPNRDQEKGRHH